jgi:hypothetical protein
VIGWFDAESAWPAASREFDVGIAAASGASELVGALSAGIGSFGIAASGTVEVQAVLSTSIGAMTMTTSGYATSDTAPSVASQDRQRRQMRQAGRGRR